MSRKTSNNNDLLSSVRKDTSPKVYSLLVDLVNDEREDLAELVLKIDYLLEYSSACIRQKDFEEAKETLSKVENRLKMLEKDNVDTEYIRYLYDGIKKKCK
ncbi:MULTISPECIES: hypothetical protein [unclassified Clostridium]|mgnify:FL=1|uniref:hypothetical protein n=1 Tax=unclassified Clostridium TaxID=2614128 RepID=UPI0025BE96D3|nr:hypothetical protein [Clostridium sp.]MCI6692318.1 hypothetical protein [Clostridium sp.]MDY2630939.1 hypothetical protein [Clostridium sp.]MDY4253978.1 hypothetical protein [Clostridium sp.]